MLKIEVFIGDENEYPKGMKVISEKIVDIFGGHLLSLKIYRLPDDYDIDKEEPDK